FLTSTAYNSCYTFSLHDALPIYIQQGMEVDIRTLSYPDEVFKGKIDAVSSVLDSDAKVLKARISLTNENVKLKPGMLVDVIALRSEEHTSELQSRENLVCRLLLE